MRKFYTTLLALVVAVVAFADGGFLAGHVKDRITQQLLDGVNVSVYKGDKLIADFKTRADFHMSGGDAGYYYALGVPTDSATYTFRYEKEGYETIEKTMFVKRFKKVENGRILPTVYMMPKPKTKTIDGVTVKATQIKFYHRGDTVVYNADMFDLPQGSMLDNLIKSIPGAVLTDDGEIKINGRKVDALLLNGDDFFKGKRGVMLENLPAYMVKNLKAYERQDKLSKEFGKKVEEYVLDVNLKKEYSIGWIGNIEGGAGSENRYLGRLFGLRFTTASRIGIYGNFNNLNDNRKPGANTEWTPDKMPNGLLAQKMGGIDYMIKPKFTQNKFSGNAEVKYTDADNYSETTKETYMPQGSSQFSRSRSKYRSTNFSLTTYHAWEFLKEDGISGLRLNPNFSYSRYDTRTNALSATFNGDPYDYAKSTALFDSIQHMQGDNLRRLMLNRYSNLAKYKGYSLNSNLSTGYGTKLSGVYCYVGADMNYGTSKNDIFSLYNLSYPNNTASSNEYINRYTHDKPNRNYGYNLRAKMIFRLLGGRIEAEASAGQRFRKQVYSRYNLHDLAGWGAESDHGFGELPSQREFLRDVMEDNSFDMFQVETYQSVAPEYIREFEHKSGYTTIDVTLDVEHNHRRLDYTRGKLSANPYYSDVTRDDIVLFNPDLSILRNWNDDKDEVEFKYKLSQSAPTMMNLVELNNTSDPLNSYMGNSHLKKMSVHKLSLSYRKSNPEKQTNFNISGIYNVTVNSLGYTYTIDKATGKREYTRDNINGNYYAYITSGYSTPLDKKRKLTFNTNTLLMLTHGVDYISEETGVAPQRSSADTWWGTERINLNYRLGKHSIGLKGYVGVAHVTSSRKGFDEYTLCDFNYGLTGVIRLPWNFELSTDLTMYSRRGYATSAANTNDLVWNARLSKTFLKQGLTIAVDGFDILNNLSNITQYVNSQGRTETYYNSLPHYVMAHVIYRFNIHPKKK